MGLRALAVAAVTVIGCGGAADHHPMPMPMPEQPVALAGPPEFGFHAGEAMQFEVSLGGIVAGEAALAVGQPGDVDGHHAIAVRSRIATVGAAALLKKVVDDATTTIDTDTRRPLFMTTDVEYGETNSYTALVTWGASVVDVDWQKKNATTKGKVHFDFGARVAHDAHSAMAEMRQWRAPEGSRRTVWVIGGRKLWRCDLTMGASETLGTKMGGNRATIRLEGVAYRARGDLQLDTSKKPRKFTVWVSDDADRVPLKVLAGTELGDVEIDLVDYQRPE
jgi:hypothetical protein